MRSAWKLGTKLEKQHGNHGAMFSSLGEYIQAKEYYEKALCMQMEIGDRAGEGRTYLNLAHVFGVLKKYGKNKLYCDNALAISRKSDDKEAEANCYKTEGEFHQSLGDKDRAEACFDKALAIVIEIGDRELEATNYLRFGKVFQSRGDHDVAEEYLEKALSTSKDIGNAEVEFSCTCSLALTRLSQKNFEGAISLLYRSIEKSETMRGFLQGSHQMKISFVDKHVFPYEKLSGLFCDTGNPKDALTVADLGQARALADLMDTLYSSEKHIS